MANLYAVPTKALNQAVRRNTDRFPPDFVFQLRPREIAALRSQIVTSKRGGRRTLPAAFTEHGAIMAATVLNSPKAVTMSLYVVRAFIQMREQIAANDEVLKRLAEIDRTLLKHDKSLQVIWRELQPLLQPPPTPPKPQIGFHR